MPGEIDNIESKIHKVKSPNAGNVPPKVLEQFEQTKKLAKTQTKLPDLEESLISINDIQKGNLSANIKSHPVQGKEIFENDILSSDTIREKLLGDPFDEDPVPITLSNGDVLTLKSMKIAKLMKIMKILSKINFAITYPEMLFLIEGEADKDFPIFKEYIELVLANSICSNPDINKDNFLDTYDMADVVTISRYVFWMNDMDLLKKKTDQRTKGKSLGTKKTVN
jgi:hypothetical protein